MSYTSVRIVIVELATEECLASLFQNVSRVEWLDRSAEIVALWASDNGYSVDELDWDANPQFAEVY